MTEWTCIKCEDKYTELTGDTDERMCEDCLDEFYHEEDAQLEKDIKNGLYGE